MEKKYFAYFHYEGAWFGFITNNPEKRQCVNWMLNCTPEYLREQYNINFYIVEKTKIITKREALNKIKSFFPDLIPIHVIEWRIGVKKPGSCEKKGSRPYKGWTKKDYFKQSKIEKY